MRDDLMGSSVTQELACCLSTLTLLREPRLRPSASILNADAIRLVLNIVRHG